MKLFVKFKHIYLKIIELCLQSPKRIIRLVVLSGCCIIVFFQLWKVVSLFENLFFYENFYSIHRECVGKLLKPPVSTHSNFVLNETMHYPAITFCRKTPFKAEVLKVKKKKLEIFQEYSPILK